MRRLLLYGEVEDSQQGKFTMNDYAEPANER